MAVRPYGGEMPEAPGDPIAYSALQPGTPVQTSDGYHFATVQAVLVDEKVSVFDGIVVQTEEGARFVDADHVASIYTTYVRTTLSAEQAENLPEPDGSTLVDIKPARSIGDRVRRMFGRK
jgi:sporulation protein YlmC with PRC-barrel domain